jgi:predicted phage terminase large subunit-like protein
MDRRTFLKGAAAVAVGGKMAEGKKRIKSPVVKGRNVEINNVRASVCRDGFYAFVKEFWDVIVPETPVWNWHIEYICNELQKVAERVFRNEPKKYDEVINISPGTTKSTIASVMYLPWIWTRMPSARFIGGSYAKDLSMDLSRRSRDVVKSEKYRAAFPEIELRSDQDVKSYFANTAGGARMATSTGGAILGFHGHFIVVDDPLNPNEALSEIELENANNWIKNTLSQRKVDKNLTPIILIMQRLHQNDPSAHLIQIAKEAQQIALRSGEKNPPLKLKHVCLPAELTENVKPKGLRKFYKNRLMDRIRLPWEVLNDNRALGSYFYSGQFLQNPVPLGGGMFKTDRIIMEDVAPPPSKFKMIVRGWDKAATADDGAFTAGPKIGVDFKGRFWILHCLRGQWSSERRETIIKQTAMVDGRRVIVALEQEPGSGGKESAESTAKNLAGFRVRIIRPTGDKALRADPFSVQVNNRNVYMVRGEWNEAYLDELKFFPLSTYKDQVDGSSTAFNILAKGKKKVGAFPRLGARRIIGYGTDEV